MGGALVESADSFRSALGIHISSDGKAASEGHPPPVLIRRFLSGDQIAALQSYVRQLTPHGEDGDGWLMYSDDHEVKYLHHGGEMHDEVWRNLEEACPELHAHIIGHMRRVAHDMGLADASEELRVRCIEHHTYTVGGELCDANHTDLGSRLTLSILLSEPGPATHGGRFTTTDAAGNVTMHELDRGDAVLLCSETVHNVTRVERGERRTMVWEMWTGRTNKVDRFR